MDKFIEVLDRSKWYPNLCNVIRLGFFVLEGFVLVGGEHEI